MAVTRVSEGSWTFESDRDGSHATCHDLNANDMEMMGIALRRAGIYDFRKELQHGYTAATGIALYNVKADGEAADAIQRQYVIEQAAGSRVLSS